MDSTSACPIIHEKLEMESEHDTVQWNFARPWNNSVNGTNILSDEGGNRDVYDIHSRTQDFFERI